MKEIWKREREKERKRGKWGRRRGGKVS